MKAKVGYKAVNRRLGEKKSRTLTVNIEKDLYDNNDVTAMEKEAESQIKRWEQHDTYIEIKSIRIGRTLFEINRKILHKRR